MIVRFLTAAEQELRAAAVFCEARLPGLASAFLAEVERMCAMLSEHGVLGRRCDERHRSLRLRRFPFSVIYRVDGGAIEVVAVAHLGVDRNIGQCGKRRAATR